MESAPHRQGIGGRNFTEHAGRKKFRQQPACASESLWSQRVAAGERGLQLVRAGERGLVKGTESVDVGEVVFVDDVEFLRRQRVQSHFDIVDHDRHHGSAVRPGEQRIGLHDIDFRLQQRRADSQ